MSQAVQSSRPYPAGRNVRFGPFELSLETGELRKHGVRVRLQHRPFQILAALIESPGRLVTREELRNRLWSSDVFVDFESGLNTAVNRLRLALGDSAENPVYVETLSRLGYRFLARIETSYDHPQQIAPAAIAVIPQGPDVSPEFPVALAPQAPAPARRTWMFLSVLAAALLFAIAAGVIRSNLEDVSFARLTFRKGFISQARFSKDGEQVIYSAEWNGAASRLFSLATNRPESKDLNVADVSLAGVASPTEFGLFVKSPKDNSPVLALASLTGGAQRSISAHVVSADWGPGGSLATITNIGPSFFIEYPRGHRLYQSLNWISDLRVSPDGARLAFCEHPVPMDDGGQVRMLKAATGESRTLSRGWGSLEGLAWTPSGNEVWFSASRSGIEKSLWAVSLDSRTRLVSQSAGGLELRDISRSGQVLITRSNQHMNMLLGDLQQKSETDISWLDWSHAAAISADGSTVLFDESGSGGGSSYSVFVRRLNASAPERVGSGRALDLSADGRSVLAGDAADASKLFLLAVDTHAVRAVPSKGFVYRWTKFFPDAQQILSAGHYPGQADRIYRQRLSEPPQLLNSSLQLDEAVIDPSGKFAAGVSETCEINILDLSNGQARAIPVGKMAYPVVFLDASRILTRTAINRSIALDILDTGTGQMRPFHRIEPADSTGLAHTFPLRVSGNLKTYVYSRAYHYSDLFLVSGLR